VHNTRAHWRIKSTDLAVGESSLVEELQENGENVRVRLVHFVKQDHGIGAFPQQLENKYRT
jgi:hypothetical protein